MYFDSLAEDLLGINAQSTNLLINRPLDWWIQRGHSQYPILYKMVLDYLTIPSTSCECERCFSGGRRTITDDCNCLSGETIEALQLQKNWIRNNAVTSYLTDLMNSTNRLDKKVQEQQEQ
jgi:hypothetical protein